MSETNYTDCVLNFRHSSCVLFIRLWSMQRKHKEHNAKRPFICGFE